MRQPRPAVDASRRNGYGQILTSTALVGGSTLISVAFGIIRTKGMALLLGPAGFGLTGLYSSVADVVQSVSGMGIQNSGVRQIAEAAGCDDVTRVARTATVLRRTSLVCGAIGALVLLLFAVPLATLTFGGPQRAAGIALLALVVFFKAVSGGQSALVQGMRRVADLAAINIIGAVVGTGVAIPLVYWFGERGIVPSLVCVAGSSVLVSWWYSRKLRIPSTPIPFEEVRHETKALLRLGVAFMGSGLMTMGSAYAVRVIVLHSAGPEATGFYQSAWTLGGLYVGFILQAMGTDFYPRLTAHAHDDEACNRLVNEQTRVGLLLGGPGAVATLTFAPLVVAIFYSARFGGSVPVLRWICLGAALRVMTWPMGFVLLAKGKSGLFFAVDLTWTIVNVSLTWFLVGVFGVAGAGMAFFGSYVVHGMIVYPLVARLSGFRWTGENRRTALLLALLTAAVFVSSGASSSPLSYALGLVLTLVAGAYSLAALITLVPSARVARVCDRLPAWVGRCVRTRLPEVA
jgi:antigen flippase